MAWSRRMQGENLAPRWMRSAGRGPTQKLEGSRKSTSSMKRPRERTWPLPWYSSTPSGPKPYSAREMASTSSCTVVTQ